MTISEADFHKAMELVAGCWCDESTSRTQMDPVLAEAFVRRVAPLIAEVRRLRVVISCASDRLNLCYDEHCDEYDPCACGNGAADFLDDALEPRPLRRMRAAQVRVRFRNGQPIVSTPAVAEAEARLISSAFKDPTIRQRIQVTSEQFFDLKLRLVWDAMEEGDFDALVVCDRMGANLDACGGMAYISGLTLAHSNTGQAEYYADRVRDAYLKREVQSKASEILHADDEVTGQDLLSTLVASSDSLTASLSASSRTLATTVGEEREWVLRGTGEPRGLPMGLGVDRWIPGGVARKKVFTLFADTGCYKTTAVNQMMFHMASCGHRGLLVPLEDGDDLTAHRFMSIKTGVPYGRIAGGVCNDAERQKIELLTPGDWASLENIVSCDGIEPKIDNIIREVAAEHARGGLDFVIVDYLQLLEGRGKPADVLTEAMRKAANAAKRYDLVWIFLSQQNDRNDDRKDPRPTLKDLFGSAAMKQMSKTVFALFRPYEHWPDLSGSDRHPLYGMYSRMVKNPVGAKIYPNLVELWMLKNVLGKKKSMQGLIAKPEVGILDPVDLRAMTGGY